MLDLTKPIQTHLNSYAKYIAQIIKNTGERILIIEYKTLNNFIKTGCFNEDGNFADIEGCGPTFIRNVPELKLEVNKFYWTQDKHIAKLTWEISSNERYFGLLFPANSIDYCNSVERMWDKYGTVINYAHPKERIIKELTPQELEEYGLVGK